MVCATDEETGLGLKFVTGVPSPLYCAVMVCEPTESTDVVNVATADVVLTSGAVPINTLPSKKETVPLLGTAKVVVVSVTVAVSVAGVPNVAELGAVKTVIVLSTAAQIPAAANRKRTGKDRKRKIPPEMERAIEVTFDCGQQQPQRLGGIAGNTTD